VPRQLAALHPVASSFFPDCKFTGGPSTPGHVNLVSYDLVFHLLRPTRLGLPPPPHSTLKLHLSLGRNLWSFPPHHPTVLSRAHSIYLHLCRFPTLLQPFILLLPYSPFISPAIHTYIPPCNKSCPQHVQLVYPRGSSSDLYRTITCLLPFHGPDPSRFPLLRACSAFASALTELLASFATTTLASPACLDCYY
jgi:hypothetical protein